MEGALVSDVGFREEQGVLSNFEETLIWFREGPGTIRGQSPGWRLSAFSFHSIRLYG